MISTLLSDWARGGGRHPRRVHGRGQPLPRARCQCRLLVVRSVDEVDLVHGHKEEVDLFVVDVDEVDLVHRSDEDAWSTSSSWPRGRPSVWSIDGGTTERSEALLGRIRRRSTPVDSLPASHKQTNEAQRHGKHNARARGGSRGLPPHAASATTFWRRRVDGRSACPRSYFSASRRPKTTYLTSKLSPNQADSQSIVGFK